MKKRALITGIAGQDGSYLAELLLKKGYEVQGIALPIGRAVKFPNLEKIANQVVVYMGSLEDREWVADVVKETDPHECYHLAASSFVSYAFEEEHRILQNNLNGTHNLLGALREFAPSCRLFFAGSSEMFGEVEQTPQNELTPFRPRSVYGISKTAGHHLVCYYRKQHGLFACTGILYNHESIRRGLQFVTRKITSEIARIKLGKSENLHLGNLDAVRDWGYAPDYVQGMWLMLQQESPDDFVFATDVGTSVRRFVEMAFSSIGLDYREYVVVNPNFYREAEKVPLIGNPKKARELLGWKPEKPLQEMISEMVENDLMALAGDEAKGFLNENS